MEYLGLTNPIEPDQEPLPVATQTVDASQQTDDMSDTQEPDDREEKLNEEIRYLQEELQMASDENKQKADQLAFDLETMESQYTQKMANLTMKISEEITKKDMEVLKIKDECGDRIADLELCNATLMQRIVELETEKVAPSQSLPPTGISSGQLDPTLDKMVSQFVLEQITSVTSYSRQPNEEKEKLIKDLQIIQSEMEAVKLALSDAKKTIADMEKLQSLWIVSESQMKAVADEKESLLASKDAELNELRKALQQATLKSQLTTRDVGCGTEDLPPLPTTTKTEKSSSCGDKQAASEQQQGAKNKTLYSEKLKQPQNVKTEAEAAKQPKPTAETKTEKVAVPPTADVRCKEKPVKGNPTRNPSNGTKPVTPTPRKQTDAKPLAAAEKINVKAAGATAKPADGFVIVSKEITQTERTDTVVLLDIPATHYGRIVGRGGENVKRMQESHSVGLSLVQSITTKDCYNMIIRGGNLEKRRAAAQEIIGALPVTIECPNVDIKKLYAPEFKSRAGEFFVKIKKPTTPAEKLTISGRLKDCRTAYSLLVGGTLPPSSPK